MFYFVIIFHVSTAVKQAVACTPVMQRAQVRSPIGKSFLVEFFRVFPLPIRQMSGSFRPIWFPEYHLAIIIILIISALLECINERMVCIVFNVRVVSEVDPALS